MKRNINSLEKEVDEFLKEPHNVFMRAGSRTLVFIETGYVCLLGIVDYINYVNANKEELTGQFGEGIYSSLQMGVPFLMVICGLGLSYGASKLYGYFYNKVAEKDFREKRN